MKRILTCIVVIICVIAGYGWLDNGRNLRDTLADRFFTYEKEGFGGDFNIKLNDDGSFTYSTGIWSSFLGIGEWTLADGVVVLAEDKDFCAPLVHRFKVDKGALVFIAEGSDPFPDVNVSDGERFIVKTEE